MKKTFLILCCITVAAVSAFAQAPGIAWEQTMGTSINDNYYFTVKTNDGGIISIYQNGFPALGVTPPINLNYKLQVQKFDANGTSQWKDSFSTGGISRGDSYYYNSDGSLVILCDIRYQVSTLTDLYLVKIDSSGNLVWEKYIDYGLGGRENGSSITKTINGDYLISATTRTLASGTPTDVYILRITETGTLVWQQKYDSGGSDGAPTQSRVKIIEAADSSIYVLAESMADWNGGSRVGLWLLKLDTAGVKQWAKPVGGSGLDFLADFVLAPTGEFYVLGYGQAPELALGGMDIYFARVNMNGDVVYNKNYGSSGGDMGIQIVNVENDGDAVIAGEVGAGDVDVSGHHGSTDIWLFKIDSSGAIIWQKAIGGSSLDRILGPNGAPTSFGYGGKVLQTSDGGYLISGLTQSSDGDVSGFQGAQDIFITKLSSSGTIDWTKTLGGTGEDYPRGAPIELGSDEYVIGGITYSDDGDVSTNTGGSDPWLIKLSSSMLRLAGNKKPTDKDIQVMKEEGRAVNELMVNPNPINGKSGVARINLLRDSRVEIGVIDMKGNYKSLGFRSMNKGFNVVPLDFFGLSGGVYFLQVKIGQERLISRFVLVQ